MALMELPIIVFIVVCVLIFGFGVICNRIFSKPSGNTPKNVGTLRIDTSDPEDGPYMFLELTTDPRYVMSQKQVVLDVNTESYISHE